MADKVEMSPGRLSSKQVFEQNSAELYSGGSLATGLAGRRACSKHGHDGPLYGGYVSRYDYNDHTEETM